MARAKQPSDTKTVKPGQYADVLEEMLRKWEYATDRWRPIRAEAKTDMRYVSGDPWEQKDQRAREAAGRPIGSYDELSQYTNQVINDIRQHKRAIEVTPIGEGANDHTAEVRQSLFRQIEYRSNAQQAYTCAFQNMVERSYGFLRIKPVYCNTPTESGGMGSAFDQELLIEPLVNPDLVTVDPDFIKPDGSDLQYAWIAESWDLDRYRHRFPKAKVRDFSADLAKSAPTWMDARRIRIAEYFAIEPVSRCLYLFDDGTTQPDGTTAPVEVFEDDITRDGPYARFVEATPDRERTVEVPDVKIYLTNGFEVLEPPTRWPGKTLPIVTFFGKVLYVEVEGQGAERQILSMVRLARDPYMLYCYIRACEQELVGMTPKVPYFVRKGSLDAGELLNLQKSL
ncbi:MAG TPA: portal protein, partial [Gemmatimonadaceae bacterium]|nr:portal protein [Gemmatimonadaceae bacterium]